MAVILSFNPITKDVTPLTTPHTPKCLQHWCRKAVIKTFTLRGLSRIDSLPLPPRLKLIMGSLSLGDFLINASSLPPESYEMQTYPALCLLTNTEVNVKLVASSDQVNRNDLRFIAFFVEENQVIVIEEQTKTLTSVIQKCKANNEVIDNKFLWLLLDELVQYLLDEKIPPTTHVASDCVHFLPKNQIFIEIDKQSNTNNMPEPSAAVYESPEVLNRNNPDSRALVWAVGCILYEALALKPAFYDPEGTNPFSVYMNISNGVMPQDPANGSEALKALLKKCLVHNVTDRINLETLQAIIKGHLQQEPASSSMC